MKWPRTTLGALVTLQRGHDLPDQEREPGDVPVVTSSGVTGTHSTAAARGPGVVTGRYGTIGAVHYIEQDYWPHNTTLFVKDFKGNHRRFIAYLLTSLNLARQVSSGAVPGVNRNFLHPIQVPDIPRKEQERIASILSAYDDLMENNRRRMGLLEEAARQLYREWFVRLRFPGYQRAKIANGIPEGWMPVKLNDFVDVTHGYAFDGDQFSDSPTPRALTTPGNFRIGGGIKIDKLKYYSEEGDLDPDYVLGPFDLIVTMTDLSKMSDTLGYPAFVPQLPGISFLHNQRVGRVVPKKGWFPKHFLYGVMCDEHYRHHVVGSATGTSVKHTAPKRILSYSVTMPRKCDLINRFEEIATPVFKQINTLIEMNDHLRTARDLLLPRLMSGEIQV